MLNLNLDLNQVKISEEKLIEKALDNGFNILLFYPNTKTPNWFNCKAKDYIANKELILNEIKNKQYDYGLLLGKQLKDFGVVCFDIDIDNENEIEHALSVIKNTLDNKGIKHFVEKTQSGRYHIYIIVDNISGLEKSFSFNIEGCNGKIEFKFLMFDEV